MDNYLNQVLNDRYEIQEIIGVGGMAIVYKAYDRVDDRIVAVKILKDEYLANEEFRTRFKNESQAIAVLSHPNIVKVYDVCFGDDLQYIVMEHVEGITLKEYIERQKVLDWKEALHFVVQILRALQHAHDKGIIHRDIKPQNILLLPNASIKVTDFGIARFNRGEIDSVEDSSAIGSVHYVSPEQARGDYTDEKSDIYSVGVVLYEMLTGKMPFESETDESVAMMQMRTEAKKPTEINPSIPVGLEQITLRAMQKNAADRYQSAAEFLADLDAFKHNPEIRFDYSYFIDKTPTKYMEYPSMNKKNSKKEEKHTADERAKNVTEEDEEYEAPRNTTIPILAGIAIAMFIIVGLIAIVAFGGPIKEYFTGESSSVEDEDKGFFSRLDIFGWFNKDKLEVPNFLNKSFEEILKEYPDLAIENPPQYEYNSSYEDGHVCKQFPEAGEKVSKDTVIKLTVATSNEMVLITDVKGLTVKEAESVLRASGLTVELVPEIDESKPEGEVLFTEPSANTYTKYQGTVYVHFASSAENINSTRVPNVISYELEAAKAKIESAGLKVGTITHGASSSALKGFVISQTPEGMTAVKSSIYVNLVVGNGVPASNTAVFSISLPSLPEGSTGAIKTYLNNNAYDNIAGVNLDGGSYQLSFTGTGPNNSFKIYVDNVLIYTGNIDFTTSPPTFTNVRGYQFSTKVIIPYVIGSSEADAVSALKAAGFNRIRIEYEMNDTVPAGTVISQTPENSTTNKYPTATLVTIIISSGTEAPEEPENQDPTDSGTTENNEPTIEVSTEVQTEAPTGA